MARLAGGLVKDVTTSLWLLSGPLGSGKTVFVRGALRALGYTGRVTSPTFSLRNDYLVSRGPWRRVVHIDAYRLQHPREEAALELSWLLTQPGVLVFIEWPERLERLPRVAATRITIQHRGHARLVVVRGTTRSAADAA